jgi:peptide/nickel transport system substrate-binding protein
VAPFSSQLAREAVLTALDENAMNRLSSGTLAPGCYFLPPGMIGHPTAPCPFGDPRAGGNLALARQLVRQSDMTGKPVTVWSEARAPQVEWMTYYTQLLDEIGFRASLKVIADAVYFEIISERRLHPQTGFADWNQDFPNPVDFYQLMTSAALRPVGNLNVGEITDPHIDAQVAALGQVPTSELDAVAGQWQAVDQYAARHAYFAVFGYQTFPAFTSRRISQGYVFHPVYGWDWSSFRLK